MFISSLSIAHRFSCFIRLPLSALAAATLFTACAMPSHSGASAHPTDTTSPTLIALLDNTSWELVKWQTANQSLRTLPHGDNGKPLTLTLSAESGQQRASGYSGCNRYMGTYDLKNGMLRFGPLAGTRMACPPSSPGGALEFPYLNALAHLESTVVNAPTAGDATQSQALVLTTKDQEVLTFMRRKQ